MTTLGMGVGMVSFILRKTFLCKLGNLLLVIAGMDWLSVVMVFELFQ